MKGALSTTFVNDMWESRRLSSSDVASEMRRMIVDDHFCTNVKFVVDFVEPLLDMIHYVNKNSPCLNEIYENIYSMCERIKSITDKKNPTF